MIYILYGQPASGKTTLGKLLASHLDTPFIIDGDEFREMFTNKNYGKEGREENIRNANAVATYLNKKGKSDDWVCIYVREEPNSIKGISVNNETDVIMSLVNPYRRLRDELKANNDGEVQEVLLVSERELRKEYHVEGFEAGNPNYTVITDGEVEDTWKQLKDLLKVQ
jgi:adenylate kinase family enzyme